MIAGSMSERGISLVKSMNFKKDAESNQQRETRSKTLEHLDL